MYLHYTIHNTFILQVNLGDVHHLGSEFGDACFEVRNGTFPILVNRRCVGEQPLECVNEVVFVGEVDVQCCLSVLYEDTASGVWNRILLSGYPACRFCWTACGRSSWMSFASQ